MASVCATVNAVETAEEHFQLGSLTIRNKIYAGIFKLFFIKNFSLKYRNI